MSAAKPVFVVDDDEGIRLLLQAYLEQQGFDVTAFADGLSFVEFLRGNPEPQIVILDVMLPDIDGFEVVKRVRSFSQVPIIMLTANAEETDRIVGLELGADDYLEKPFNPRELLARIKAIRRRTELMPEPQSAPVASGNRYRTFNGFSLDTISRDLFGPDGEVIALSGTDYQLLVMLLDSSGEILTREAIAGITRGRDNLPMDRFIDVQVSRLRSRLGDDARAPTLIKTVRGKGYVFTATVASRADATLG